MDSPKFVPPMSAISIALCTCNGEHYLERQLQTLRLQVLVTEIVVVDDASTDGTWGLLLAHAAEDERFRLHRNANRLGVTRNFETALRLVTNQWVALADQDDVWRTDKIDRLRAAWDGSAGLLHHATRKFRGCEPVMRRERAGQGRKFAGGDVRVLLYRNSVVGHTVLMRTELARRLMPFPRQVPHDWWLAAGAALLDRVQYVDEFLVHYRIHANNSFHPLGSRWRRAGQEHRARLALLRTMAGWCRPETPLADFVLAYRRLLAAARRGRWSWGLWRFYFRHGAVFFGGGRPLSLTRRFRRSLAATLAAGCWSEPAIPYKLLRPMSPAKSPASAELRRVG